MKIAVTYENGQVFQHFGHTAQFKLYDVENGTVASSQVVDTNGSGHGALAGFLKDRQVDALICGGIGGGARNALAQAGIQLYPGASGGADAQVEALLAGEALPGGEGVADPSCLAMTTESLTREYPLYTPSLLNLVKTSETHVRGLDPNQ